MPSVSSNFMEDLNKLKGKVITDVLVSQGTYYPIMSEKTEEITPPQIIDEVVIVMEDYSLNISNKITVDPKSENINSFISKKIYNILESNEEVKVITTDNCWFSVDLRDEAYFGPEAMVLKGPNNLCVVWN